jgi:hypothetical protein
MGWAQSETVTRSDAHGESGQLEIGHRESAFARPMADKLGIVKAGERARNLERFDGVGSIADLARIRSGVHTAATKGLSPRGAKTRR